VEKLKFETHCTLAVKKQNYIKT